MLHDRHEAKGREAILIQATQPTKTLIGLTAVDYSLFVPPARAVGGGHHASVVVAALRRKEMPGEFE